LTPPFDKKDFVEARGGGTPFALGEQRVNGFYVRKIVWGRLMANMERRPDEQIRRAKIMVVLERFP
jgi:hypothetical protein